MGVGGKGNEGSEEPIGPPPTDGTDAVGSDAAAMDGGILQQNQITIDFLVRIVI